MNINIFTVSFPVTAIVSILHRLSGVIILFLMPFLLSALQCVTYYPKFLSLSLFGKAVTWIILSALVYHLFAGIRHLFMDCGCGESLRIARISAYLVLSLTIVFSLVIGLKLC